MKIHQECDAILEPVDQHWQSSIIVLSQIKSPRFASPAMRTVCCSIDCVFVLNDKKDVRNRGGRWGGSYTGALLLAV